MVSVSCESICAYGAEAGRANFLTAQL